MGNDPADAGPAGSRITDRSPRLVLPICPLPWAGFVLATGYPSARQSLHQLEAFPETANPGYFIVKLSAMLLAMIGVCALVLDVFEIILVIVPLLMPPLLVRAPDAVWDAVLAMLVLQGSFLAPPLGYAVMMARGFFATRLRPGAMAQVLAPDLTALALVIGLVVAKDFVHRRNSQAPM